jgi:hypothetical protein
MAKQPPIVHPKAPATGKGQVNKVPHAAPGSTPAVPKTAK